LTATYRFGAFELQSEQRRLLVDGRPASLGPRAFDVLLALVEHAGQLVSKNQLLDRVWAGLVVEENNLQVQISTLRKLLGPQAIATIPGRGYRFERPVERADALPPESASTSTALFASVAAPAPVRARTNLPTRLLSLYGRAKDLTTIKELLRQHGVVTIVGAGGIGKTRVAQAVAAEVAVESAADFPDGVWWVVDLAMPLGFAEGALAMKGGGFCAGGAAPHPLRWPSGSLQVL
jgi:DNA-binding winged helix-turn-helix (wHTH) protein